MFTENNVSFRFRKGKHEIVEAKREVKLKARGWNPHNQVNFIAMPHMLALFTHALTGIACTQAPIFLSACMHIQMCATPLVCVCSTVTVIWQSTNDLFAYSSIKYYEKKLGRKDNPETVVSKASHFWREPRHSPKALKCCMPTITTIWGTCI